MLRSSIIHKYLQDQEIYDIIGHDLLVFLRTTATYLLLLIATYLLYYLVTQYITNHIYVSWIAAGIGLLLYSKGLYDLADEYLDALVITNKGLVLFRWNGLFSYTLDQFQWVSIESFSEEQHTFRDTLFKKGNIKIKLEEERYVFKDVSKPREQTARLIHWKDKILGRYQYYENETQTEEMSKDKYELLVEALGEVVSEYVEKKKETY